MPLTSVTKDAARLTLTVVSDCPVPQKRLWDARLRSETSFERAASGNHFELLVARRAVPLLHPFDGSMRAPIGNGRPPNFRSKPLISQLLDFSVLEDAPTSAPSNRWLSPDVVGHQARR